MKGLILSGGKGTRLRPLTHTSAKQLLPIANKPVLFYALDFMQEAGISDVGIIVGDTAEEIKKAVGDGSRWGIKVTYIQQDAPLGLAHAVLTAEEFINKEPFVMYLGDNLIRGGISQFVDKFNKELPNALLLLCPVPNPELFGVAELKDDKIINLEEKPKNPKTNLALVGVYLFDYHIFEAARKIKPSFRNELEITDAIQTLIDDGYEVKSYKVTGWWKDTGKLEDILDANRLVLEQVVKYKRLGSADEKSQLIGNVSLAEGSEIINSIVRGPCIIGENTKIIDAYVGPFTAIDHDCVIRKSEIEHSIVLENSSILDIESRVENSLIGKDVVICRCVTRPKAYNFMVGDHSKVAII